jgi:ribosomal protein L7/L12
MTAAAGGGYSVFLAKITDDNRRTKVVALLEELAKLSHDDADALSKKVIIPVLRGVRKEDAEAAKQRFAKIGILARVKGPDG